jgi:hypothetical protein
VAVAVAVPGVFVAAPGVFVAAPGVFVAAPGETVVGEGVVCVVVGVEVTVVVAVPGSLFFAQAPILTANTIISNTDINLFILNFPPFSLA